MKYIFGISMTVFLSYGAADHQPKLNPRFVGVKTTLVDLVLRILLQENNHILSQESGCVDVEICKALCDGRLSVQDITANLKCPIPRATEYVTNKLSESAEIGYHDRDTVVQTYFGPRLREGQGFVKDRAALFEALHNQPQIARAIKQKQKEKTTS